MKKPPETPASEDPSPANQAPRARPRSGGISTEHSGEDIKQHLEASHRASAITQQLPAQKPPSAGAPATVVAPKPASNRQSVPQQFIRTQTIDQDTMKRVLAEPLPGAASQPQSPFAPVMVSPAHADPASAPARAAVLPALWLGGGVPGDVSDPPHVAKAAAPHTAPTAPPAPDAALAQLLDRAEKGMAMLARGSKSQPRKTS